MKLVTLPHNYPPMKIPEEKLIEFVKYYSFLHGEGLVMDNDTFIHAINRFFANSKYVPTGKDVGRMADMGLITILEEKIKFNYATPEAVRRQNNTQEQ